MECSGVELDHIRRLGREHHRVIFNGIADRFVGHLGHGIQDIRQTEIGQRRINIDDRLGADINLLRRRGGGHRAGGGRGGGIGRKRAACRFRVLVNHEVNAIRVAFLGFGSQLGHDFLQRISRIADFIEPDGIELGKNPLPSLAGINQVGVVHRVGLGQIIPFSGLNPGGFDAADGALDPFLPAAGIVHVTGFLD